MARLNLVGCFKMMIIWHNYYYHKVFITIVKQQTIILNLMELMASLKKLLLIQYQKHFLSCVMQILITEVLVRRIHLVLYLALAK